MLCIRANTYDLVGVLSRRVVTASSSSSAPACRHIVLFCVMGLGLVRCMRCSFPVPEASCTLLLIMSSQCNVCTVIAMGTEEHVIM